MDILHLPNYIKVCHSPSVGDDVMLLLQKWLQSLPFTFRWLIWISYICQIISKFAIHLQLVMMLCYICKKWLQSLPSTFGSLIMVSYIYQIISNIGIHLQLVMMLCYICKKWLQSLPSTLGSLIMVSYIYQIISNIGIHLQIVDNVMLHLPNYIRVCHSPSVGDDVMLHLQKCRQSVPSTFRLLIILCYIW